MNKLVAGKKKKHLAMNINYLIIWKPMINIYLFNSRKDEATKLVFSVLIFFFPFFE